MTITETNIISELNCSEETADYILKTLDTAKIENVTGFRVVEENEYYIVEVISHKDQKYYAILSPDYFISSIRKDSLKGEIIYREFT